MPHKHNFSLDPIHDKQLLEIQKKFGLCKSDSVRRGIELLYDYLINDKQPEDSKAAQIENKAEKADKSQ